MTALKFVDRFKNWSIGNKQTRSCQRKFCMRRRSVQLDSFVDLFFWLTPAMSISGAWFNHFFKVNIFSINNNQIHFLKNFVRKILYRIPQTKINYNKQRGFVIQIKTYKFYLSIYFTWEFSEVHSLRMLSLTRRVMFSDLPEW